VVQNARVRKAHVQLHLSSPSNTKERDLECAHFHLQDRHTDGLVRGDIRGTFSAMKILLAIDDSKFAEAATHAVLSQVRQDHTQVLVLHVMDWSNFMPTPFPVVGVQPLFSEGQLESIIKSETQRAQDLVKTAAERLRSAGFDASISVREGAPKMVILDCATEWGADLIVVGSHGRKGLTRFVLGSVSEAVARHAHCSVEIVRLPINS